MSGYFGVCFNPIFSVSNKSRIDFRQMWEKNVPLERLPGQELQVSVQGESNQGVLIHHV